MYIFITVLIVIISILLGLIVLIQNPKGGGVNSTFGGASQQIFGAARATDVVEKSTWTLAVMLIAFTLLSTLFLGKTSTLPKGQAAQNGKAPTTTTTNDEADKLSKRANEIGAGAPAQSAPAAPAPQQK